MDWLKQLELVKKERSLTDTEMANELGVSKGFLADVKVGRRPMPALMKLKVADRRGFDVTLRSMMKLLLDEQTMASIEEIEGERKATKAQQDPRLEKLFYEVNEALDLYTAEELLEAITSELKRVTGKCL